MIVRVLIRNLTLNLPVCCLLASYFKVHAFFLSTAAVEPKLNMNVRVLIRTLTLYMYVVC